MSNADTTPFGVWWYNHGSSIIPLPGHDAETHAHRVARIAWDAALHYALNDILDKQ